MDRPTPGPSGPARRDAPHASERPDPDWPCPQTFDSIRLAAQPEGTPRMAEDEEPKEDEEKKDSSAEDEAEERSSPSGKIVYKAILKEAEDELERPSSALFWSGLAAGLSMGFSLVGEGLLRAHLPDKPWRPLVAKLGYSVGFLIVILGRQQLFTENTLTPILPLLQRRDARTLGN